MIVVSPELMAAVLQMMLVASANRQIWRCGGARRTRMQRLKKVTVVWSKVTVIALVLPVDYAGLLAGATQDAVLQCQLLRNAVCVGRQRACLKGYGTVVKGYGKMCTRASPELMMMWSLSSSFCR